MTTPAAPDHTTRLLRLAVDHFRLHGWDPELVIAMLTDAAIQMHNRGEGWWPAASLVEARAEQLRTQLATTTGKDRDQ